MKTLTFLRSLHGLLGVTAAALLVSGCQVATSTQPIGATPVRTPQFQLDGVWRSGDGQPFFVRTADADAGRLEVAIVTTNQNGFVLEHHEVLLRKQEDTVFANIRSRAPDPEENYTFGRLTAQDNSLVLTLASSRALRPLALDGTVQASVTTNQQADGTSYSVVVTNGFDRLATRLASPDGWQWLDTENPIVLTRQKAGLN